LADCINNPDYIRTYRDARQLGHYIILDNGCAEGDLATSHQLLAFAGTIKPHEIVAPDVLDDGERTLEMTLEFIHDDNGATDYNIMAVLQGTSHEERKRYLRKYAKEDAITAIGVPKIQVRTQGSDGRLKTVRYINQEYGDRFDIHLLGLNKKFPTEMFDLPWGTTTVRSMDSAQPYKVTEGGRLMTGLNAWGDRRADYFSRQQIVDDELLDMNIEVFKQWAGAV
jgi:hypothetical protein